MLGQERKRDLSAGAIDDELELGPTNGSKAEAGEQRIRDLAELFRGS